MPGPEIIITNAGADDSALITQLSVTTFVETFAADNGKEDMDKYIAQDMSEERLHEELGDTANRFFVVWVDGEAAGYAKMRATKRPVELQAANPAEIERIYILRHYHGQKAGAALMQHCTDLAVANGNDVLWLGVWEHNHRAVNFYKRWGFEVFGSHIFRLGNDDQTDIMMKKHL